MKEYLTINSVSVGEYTEKRSKFIAGAYPCSSEAEATEILERVRSANFGANHNVYAYILRDGTTRFSDDGEPHGTAGKPVLEVVSGSKITNMLVVVTRYFGGVLLGTGGLVRAYTAAAKAAVDNAKPARMCESAFYTVRFDYSFHTKMNTLIENCGGVILNTEFTDKVEMKYVLPLNREEQLNADICETFSSRIKANLDKYELYPFDFDIIN